MFRGTACDRGQFFLTWAALCLAGVALGCAGNVSGTNEVVGGDDSVPSETMQGGSGGGAAFVGDTGGSSASSNTGGSGGQRSSSGGTGGNVAGMGGQGGQRSSPDAGAGGMPFADAGTPVGTPTFVAVGYAGRRIRSVDLGKTWIDDQKLGGGGDDQYLLRGVEFGNGRFVAVGWKILTSPDGKTWIEQKNPQNQWLQGIKWGNGIFAATGGYGYAAYSRDGVSWMNGKARADEAARSLAFGMGKFVTATDNGNWWSSTDGINWTRGEGGHQEAVVYCDPLFLNASACKSPVGHGGGRTAFGAGVWVSLGDAGLERSVDGTTWSKVSVSAGGLESIAFGYSQ
jgi:hypothetical protein